LLRVGSWVRAGCAALAALLPATMPAQAEPSAAGIFRLQATDAQNRDTSGTAVLVARDTLVTSCHVVSNAREITIEAGNAIHPVRVLRAHRERDVCLLTAPALDAPVATLGETATLLPGAAIVAAGYSKGRPLSWSSGTIEGVYSYDGRGRVVQGSAAFEEGASGGGLFDASGRLIGILTYKARVGGPFHFSAPVEWVKDLLADAPRTDRADGAPFWQTTGSGGPTFLRVASLAARGDCPALAQVAGQWLKKEPTNPEAGMAARSLHHCELIAAGKTN
jgi:S1-C subfamily serine protease